MTAAFLRRDFPHANSVLLSGPRPVLVDSGAPGGEAGLLDWLGERRPALLVNTHWHSDHTGGNRTLMGRGVPIAAAAAEAEAVNRGDPDACRSRYLGQVVPPYRVERGLRPGDRVETGAAGWRVVALPGHTAAQIGLFDPASGVLVGGDAVHAADVGWLDLQAEPAALEQLEATVAGIAALAPRCILPGHGPVVTDVAAALDGARRRIAGWRAKPEGIAWHACKRIFGHMLFSENGLERARVEPALLELPWFQDHAERAFGVPAAAFVPLLLAEMIRSGAAVWVGSRLMPGGAQSSPPRR